MPAKNTKKTVIVSFLTVAIVALITALGLGFYFNRQRIFDSISANSYSPSAAIATIESKINFTDDGDLIFRASHPSLESRDNFNERCKSHNEEVSVLGCYTNGTIYLYNIEEPELNGIVESTAAHELLHAVWERTSQAEKSSISAALIDVYNDEKYHELLAEDLDSYADDERIEELHSRVGTEIATLPDVLEQHYAKYFKNQDLVVDYYNNYITPFRELSEEIDNLSSKLDELNTLIEQKTSAYYKYADDLSAKIDDFNQCAKTPNCFANDVSLFARRNTLVGEQNTLGDMYSELNQLINDYNLVVEEYNSNVLRGRTLEQAINSNKQVEKLN